MLSLRSGRLSDAVVQSLSLVAYDAGAYSCMGMRRRRLSEAYLHMQVEEPSQPQHYLPVKHGLKIFMRWLFPFNIFSIPHLSTGHKLRACSEFVTKAESEIGEKRIKLQHSTEYIWIS